MIRLIDGNGTPYYKTIPKLYILNDINNVALQHIFKSTGLQFEKIGLCYVATPKNYKQVLALLMTYNFKTQYYNNANIKNTIYLKFSSNECFNIDTICYNCAKRNNIKTNFKKKTIIGV
jgi:predicted glycosyltransferase